MFVQKVEQEKVAKERGETKDNRSFIVTFENPDKILPLIFGEDRSVETVGRLIVLILTSTGLHDVLSLLKFTIVLPIYLFILVIPCSS